MGRRELGLIKTENQIYKIKKQTRGSRRASQKPRCPVYIYEKSSDGGWETLDTLDAEKPSSDKRSASPRLEDDSTSWENAIEAIRFYDESDIIDEKRRF